MDISSESHLFRFRGDNINTINELVNNVIWHSKVSGLNDPFEMFFNFDRDALNNLDESDLEEILKKTKVLKESNLSIEEFLRKNDIELIFNYMNGFWGDGFAGGLLREYQKNIAAACFTKKFDSRLMWGYYGNGMKGICFAYNKEKLTASEIEFSDVTYVDEAPRINIYKHLLEQIRGQRITLGTGFLLSKHSEWKGEEEVRSLKYLKGEDVYEHLPGFAVPLQERCIDAIILGERLVGDMRVFIENFAKKNDIKIMIAKADFGNYKIQIDSE